MSTPRPTELSLSIAVGIDSPWWGGFSHDELIQMWVEWGVHDVKGVIAAIARGEG